MIRIEIDANVLLSIIWGLWLVFAYTIGFWVGKHTKKGE